MSHRVRTKLSIKNPCYISPERMLELRHFVHQYEEWVKALKEWSFKYGGIRYGSMSYGDRLATPKPTEEQAELRDYYISRIMMVEDALTEAFDELPPKIWDCVLEAITTNKSYDWLKTKHNVPFGKDYYFRRYRKFYWLLDKVRK